MKEFRAITIIICIIILGMITAKAQNIMNLRTQEVLTIPYPEREGYLYVNSILLVKDNELFKDLNASGGITFDTTNLKFWISKTLSTIDTSIIGSTALINKVYGVYQDSVYQTTGAKRPYLNGGICFDGIDDQLINSNAYLKNTDTFTIMFTFKPITLVQDRYYFEFLGASASFRISMLTGLAAVSGSDQEDIIFILNNGGTSYGYTNTSPIKVGEEQKVIILFNGLGATNADKLKIYINGNPQTLAFTGTIPAITPNNTFTLYLGSQNGKYINSCYEEMRILTRLITTEEITNY